MYLKKKNQVLMYHHTTKVQVLFQMLMFFFFSPYTFIYIWSKNRFDFMKMSQNKYHDLKKKKNQKWIHYKSFNSFVKKMNTIIWWEKVLKYFNEILLQSENLRTKKMMVKNELKVEKKNKN